MFLALVALALRTLLVGVWAPGPLTDVGSQQDAALFVTETLPVLSEGGGLRSIELMHLAATVLKARLCIFPRLNPGSDAAFEGATVIGDQSGLTTRTFPSGSVISNYPELTRQHRLTYAMLAMWSYHVAPSGDVHLTIPELNIPQVRSHAPEACVVVFTDDIQHRRFRIEMNLSAESSARLANRELDAYLAADGVFFASREDREEVEALMWRRRTAVGASPTRQMPALLTLPYAGSEAVTSRGLASWWRGPHQRARSRAPPLLLYLGSSGGSNKRAVSWLVHEVMPLIRARLPQQNLSLAGNPRLASEFAGEPTWFGGKYRAHVFPGVPLDVLGFVEDLDELLSRTTVLLLPTFVDSGVTTKVIAGIRARVPIVTTSIGRRGIWHPGDSLPPACQSASTPPLLLRDTPSSFAAAVLELLDNEGVYERTEGCLRAFGPARDVEKEQLLAMQAMQRHCGGLRVSRGRLRASASGERQQAGGRSGDTPAKARAEAQAEPWQSSVGVAPLPQLMRDGSLAQRGPDPSVDGHPAASDTSDAVYRAALTAHTSWSSTVSGRRALDLTILTTFVAKDDEFVAGWLDDLALQRSSVEVYVVEVVIGTFEQDAYDLMVSMISRNLAKLVGYARISVDLFAEDPGIYGMWDAIIARPSTGALVTTWSVDDRKSPDSLRLRLNALNFDTTADVITAGTLLFTEPNATWATRELTKTTRLFDLRIVNPDGYRRVHATGKCDGECLCECSGDRARRRPAHVHAYVHTYVHVCMHACMHAYVPCLGERSACYLSMADMFTYRWEGREYYRGSRVVATGSQNVPHNSPMWRKEMHMRLGGFRPRDNRRGCYDFSFWTRAMREGHKFRHLNEPLEMYLRRETSHGHRTHAYAGAGASPETRTWVNECDTPEEWALCEAYLEGALWEAYVYKIRWSGSSARTYFSTWSRTMVAAFLLGGMASALALLAPLLHKPSAALLPAWPSSWVGFGGELLLGILPALLVLLLVDPGDTGPLKCTTRGICRLAGPLMVDFKRILVHIVLAGTASVTCTLARSFCCCWVVRAPRRCDGAIVKRLWVH